MWARRNVMKWKQVNHKYRERKTSRAALDQDPKKCACHIKNNTNQVHHCPQLEHSVWIHRISAYLTILHRELVSRGKCLHFFDISSTTNNLYNNFLLCFITDDEQRVDWGGRWILNVTLNKKWMQGRNPFCLIVVYLISVTSLVEGDLLQIWSWHFLAVVLLVLWTKKWM